jgi:hypothetical protein
MKIITNQKLIARNKVIGQVTTLASLVILGGGLYFSFQQNFDEGGTASIISLTALLVGFALSQVGIYFGNKWGKSPRPDEVISNSLKGLDDKYLLYHYNTPVSHLLVGPAGIWTLIPYSLGGKITYDNGKWRQKGGSFYMKLFGQESLGRPDLEAISEINRLKKYFKDCSQVDLPDPEAVLVFSNEKAIIEADKAPFAALPAKKVKEYIRKQVKESKLTNEKLAVLEELLPK